LTPQCVGSLTEGTEEFGEFEDCHGTLGTVVGVADRLN